MNLLLILFSMFAFSEEKKAQNPNWEDYYWGGEICVLYDYRFAIRKNLELGPNVFAIEVKNQNGGSFEKVYPLQKKKKQSKAELKKYYRLQFLKANQDLLKLVDKGKCDRIEIFYPDKDKEESEI